MRCGKWTSVRTWFRSSFASTLKINLLWLTTCTTSTSNECALIMQALLVFIFQHRHKKILKLKKHLGTSRVEHTQIRRVATKYFLVYCGFPGRFLFIDPKSWTNSNSVWLAERLSTTVTTDFSSSNCGVSFGGFQNVVFTICLRRSSHWYRTTSECGPYYVHPFTPILCLVSYFFLAFRLIFLHIPKSLF